MADEPFPVGVKCVITHVPNEADRAVYLLQIVTTAQLVVKPGDPVAVPNPFAPGGFEEGRAKLLSQEIFGNPEVFGNERWSWPVAWMRRLDEHDPADKEVASHYRWNLKQFEGEVTT